MLFVVNVQKYLHPKPEAQGILSGLGCGKFESVIDNLDNFDENVGLGESLKNHLFSKKADKNWIKNSLGDIISKENIDSYIAELDLDSAKEKLQGIFDWQEDVKNNGKTWQDYFDTCKGGNEYLIDLIENTDDLSKLTSEDLVKANQQARASTLAHNKALKAQTLSAKASTIAFKALSIAGNLIAMWGIAKAISLAVSLWDHFNVTVKEIQENIDTLTSNINTLNTELSELNNKNNLTDAEQQ